MLAQKDELEVERDSVDLYLRALEISQAAENYEAIFHSILKIIEKGLLITTQLKYNTGAVISDRTRTCYMQIIERLREQVLFNPKLKVMLDQFYLMTMQGFTDSIPGSASFLNTQLEELILIEKLMMSNVRPKLFKQRSLSEIDQFEKILCKLYETGDKVMYLLTKLF